MVTGKDKEATPDGEVVMVVYGEEDKSDEIVIGHGDDGKFKPDATDVVEVDFFWGHPNIL